MSGFRAGTRTSLGQTHLCLRTLRLEIRDELVALLYPLGNSFEDLGLDADHLFRRVNMQKVA